MTTILRTVHLSDMTGGLVTNRPPTELEINQSPDLDNIIMMTRGFKKRLGDSAFCTAMNSGVNVQGLTYYKPVSGTEYMVAVCGDKIYKSDALDGTMDEITGGLTVAANQNNIWTFAKLNDLCIGVGGAPNAPFKWSGSGNAAALGGSPVSGKFCFQMKDRLFIGSPSAAPSTIYWSILSNPEDWSGAGSGNSAVVTNDGDTLVGGTPLNNNLALLFKERSIHHMVVESAPFPIRPLNIGIGACGKMAIANAGGLIFFVSCEPRAYVTDGYSVARLSDGVDDIWDGINKARIPYINTIHDPVRNYVHFIFSHGTAITNNYDLIWDINHNCWLRNTTGFDCNVVCLASGYRLFGGHTNGIIYEKYKASTYNDASETAPGAVNSYRYTPWISNLNNISAKTVRSAVINFKTQTSGSIKWAAGFDYNKDIINGLIDQTDVGGQWDMDTWNDTFIWGGAVYSQKMIDIGSRGNNFQLKIYNDTAGQTMEMHSIDFLMKEEGNKELTNK